MYKKIVSGGRPPAPQPRHHSDAPWHRGPVHRLPRRGDLHLGLRDDGPARRGEERLPKVVRSSTAYRRTARWRKPPNYMVRRLYIRSRGVVIPTITRWRSGMEEVEQGHSLLRFKRLKQLSRKLLYCRSTSSTFVPLYNLPLSFGSSKDNFVLAHSSR